MYSKEEASRLKQSFWTVFGQYLFPQLSAEGLKINWINYKTGIKNLHFKMDADSKTASIAIEITHPDAGIQELFFEQFKELKNVLNSCLPEEWLWQLHLAGENGKMISKISKSILQVNVFDRNDWPAIISFLKPRITALDEFWSTAKYSFDDLN